MHEKIDPYDFDALLHDPIDWEIGDVDLAHEMALARERFTEAHPEYGYDSNHPRFNEVLQLELEYIGTDEITDAVVEAATETLQTLYERNRELVQDNVYRMQERANKKLQAGKWIKIERKRIGNSISRPHSAGLPTLGKRR